MENSLTIIWTNSDPVTSHNMVFMYATNAKLNSWFEEVTVVLWGSTQKYMAEDTLIQEKLKIAQKQGVKFSACISCSNNLQLTKKLNDLGIETIRWGEKLSNLLKSGEKVLTF